jgi:hypothetical protein
MLVPLDWLAEKLPETNTSASAITNDDVNNECLAGKLDTGAKNLFI